MQAWGFAGYRIEGVGVGDYHGREYEFEQRTQLERVLAAIEVVNLVMDWDENEETRWMLGVTGLQPYREGVERPENDLMNFWWVLYWGLIFVICVW